MAGTKDQYAGATFVPIPAGGNGDNPTCDPHACCATDFDHNGAVELSDLILYVRDWFDKSTFTLMSSKTYPQVIDLFQYLGTWYTGGC